MTQVVTHERGPPAFALLHPAATVEAEVMILTLTVEGVHRSGGTRKFWRLSMTSDVMSRVRSYGEIWRTVLV